MTARLVLGVDPGNSGAIAMLADGAFAGVVDMPVVARKSSGFEIDVYNLADSIREQLRLHPGAYYVAALEAVGPRPGKDGAMQAFRFGQSLGSIRGVLGTLRLPMVSVAPVSWKKRLGLIGCEKDVSRSKAMEMFPAAASFLQRKKDVGRADAILIAAHAQAIEAVGDRPQVQTAGALL